MNLSPTVSSGETPTKGNGGVGSSNAPKIVDFEPFIVASRGRPAEGGKTEQHLESHRDGVSNTLTSVGKDNYVVEPGTLIIGSTQAHAAKRVDGISTTLTSAMGEGGGHIPMTNGDALLVEPQPIKRRRSELGKELRRAYENHEIPANENMRENYIGNDGVMPTLTCSKREQKIVEPPIIDPQGRLEKVNKPKDLAPTFRAQDYGNPPCAFYTPCRIRRLTAKECWRLQGFTDEEFEKAEKVVSSTQLYKQAGNSVTVSVIVALLSQLELGDKSWNAMSFAEREQLLCLEYPR